VLPALLYNLVFKKILKKQSTVQGAYVGKFFTLFFVLLDLLNPWTLVFADEPKKHIIPKAIQVEFTTKGTTYFERNLQKVISNLGLSIDEAYLDNYQWTSAVEYDLNKPSGIGPEASALINSVRAVLRSWFMGYHSDLVKPALALKDLGYQAVFNTFSISADPAKLKRLNKTKGAILTFQAELKEINLDISQIRAWNQNSVELGEVGFNNFQMQIADQSKPLQIRMSFYVSINSKGLLEFEVVDTAQNLNAINLKIKNYNLVIPSIEIVINGKSYPFNKNQLEHEFFEKIPSFMIQIREYLHSFATHQVPQILNTIAKQYLVKTVEELKTIDAPGGVKGRDKTFQWGLQLKELTQKDNIRLSLDSYIEDELNPNSLPQITLPEWRQASLNTLEQNQYDLALGIDLSMINRLLQLSYERKLFEKIPLDVPAATPQKCVTKPGKPGQVLKLTEAPKMLPLDYRSLPQLAWGETYIKLRIGIQVPAGTIRGLQSVMIKDRFTMNIDLVVKLKKKNRMSLTAQLWDFEPKTIQIKSGLTVLGKVFKQVILEKITNEFKSMSAGWQCNEITIGGDIPLPNSIIGVAIDLKHLVTEPTGYLALYLNFIDKKGK